MIKNFIKLKSDKDNRKILEKPLCYGACITLIILLIGVAWDKTDLIINKYTIMFRGPLLTGFITAGSFLMAIKSFSVATFKRDMFERKTEYYKFALRNTDVDDKDFPDKFMEPIEKFRKIIFLAILFCLLSSISQIAIGSLEFSAAFAIVSALSISTFFLIFKTIFTLDTVFETWFTFSKRSIENNLLKDRSEED